MVTTSRPRLAPGASFAGLIQVAGVRDLDEALMLADLGVHALGLPLRLAVHAPDLSESAATALVARLPLSVQAVCITYETDPAAVLGLCRGLGVECVQLHAELPGAALAAIKRAAPRLFVIKSLIVRPETDFETLASLAAAAAPFVDAFITDSFDPATGATGATGRTHDWEISRRIARCTGKPLILAGGLHPGNVALAIDRVRPAGVDAHTGLESPDGRKDRALVAAFVRAARAAYAALLFNGGKG